MSRESQEFYHTSDEPLELNTPDVATFNAMLPKLSLSELMWIHEKRDRKIVRRSIQHHVKAVRTAFYRVRALMAAKTRQVLVSRDPNATLQGVAQRLPKDFRVNVIVGGRTTRPRIAPSLLSTERSSRS